MCRAISSSPYFFFDCSAAFLLPSLLLNAYLQKYLRIRSIEVTRGKSSSPPLFILIYCYVGHSNQRYFSFSHYVSNKYLILLRNLLDFLPSSSSIESLFLFLVFDLETLLAVLLCHIYMYILYFGSMFNK